MFRSFAYIFNEGKLLVTCFHVLIFKGKLKYLFLLFYVLYQNRSIDLVYRSVKCINFVIAASVCNTCPGVKRIWSGM